MVESAQESGGMMGAAFHRCADWAALTVLPGATP